MWRNHASFLIFILLAVLNGCSVQSSSLFPPAPGEPTRSIFLVNHGWHAGIVVQSVDVQQAEWPELSELPQAEYLEIGWGDRDYYLSPDPGAGLAIKALLLPTSSVLHVAGIDRLPQRFFPDNEIVRLELSVAGFEQMVRRISASFFRDESGAVLPLGQGHYGYSQFYGSRETYHLCRTCNGWTATVLKAAGCPFTHAFRVSSLMSQARRFGTVVQEGRNERSTVH